MLQPLYTFFPYTTLFRSVLDDFFDGQIGRADLPAVPVTLELGVARHAVDDELGRLHFLDEGLPQLKRDGDGRDRKSTRLNSSHSYISYAVFCLKKKIN